MTPSVSRWPVCGICSEVAPYSWLGHSHHCLQNHSVSRHGAIARRADNFAHSLERAITDGELCGTSDSGMDGETLAAIAVVAGEFPDATVNAIAAAHEAFARDIRGIHYYETCAVSVACREGTIAALPPREPLPIPTQPYGPHSIQRIEPDPVAAREWILANRISPSEQYQRLVLNGSWRYGCTPYESYVVGHRT